MFCLQLGKQPLKSDLGRPLFTQGKENLLRKVAHQNHISGFFQFPGLIHKEFIPTRQTVNANFYKDVLDRLIKRINLVRPDLRISGDWFFQHDNTPAPMRHRFANFWPKNVTVLHHPSYLLDLAPADYFLFPKLKLKGRRFEDIQTI